MVRGSAYSHNDGNSHGGVSSSSGNSGSVSYRRVLWRPHFHPGLSLEGKGCGSLSAEWECGCRLAVTYSGPSWEGLKAGVATCGLWLCLSDRFCWVFAWWLRPASGSMPPTPPTPLPILETVSCD